MKLEEYVDQLKRATGELVYMDDKGHYVWVTAKGTRACMFETWQEAISFTRSRIIHALEEAKDPQTGRGSVRSTRKGSRNSSFQLEAAHRPQLHPTEKQGSDHFDGRAAR